MKPVSLLNSCLLAAVGALMAWATPVAAQDRIYRCGNEYTNQVKGRKDCKVVEGGNITVVRGTMPAAQQNSAPSTSPVRRAVSTSSSSSTPRINTPQQRARDSDAKAILEQELRRAETKQAELEKEYNNGTPDKIGGEAKNYQKYLDRVAEMKASMARNQSDIEGIKREISRLK
ncbi:hypothetical protein [Ottowia sp.]|uniref:hypothetical protein n=1 Tax=Ottowia sp. TaxID=1898956 RepID=UPI003A839979